MYIKHNYLNNFIYVYKASQMQTSLRAPIVLHGNLWLCHYTVIMHQIENKLSQFWDNILATFNFNYLWFK